MFDGRREDLVVSKLKQAFSLGCTDEEACYYAEISQRTLYTYQKKNPKFVHQKELLKSKPVLMAREAVVKNLTKDNPEFSMKFLERKKKDEFAPHSTVDNRTGKIIPIDDARANKIKGAIKNWFREDKK